MRLVDQTRFSVRGRRGNCLRACVASRPEGSLWLNLGDSYIGNGGVGMNDGARCRARRRHHESEYKLKDLAGIPWLRRL